MLWLNCKYFLLWVPWVIKIAAFCHTNHHQKRLSMKRCWRHVKKLETKIFQLCATTSYNWTCPCLGTIHGSTSTITISFHHFTFYWNETIWKLWRIPQNFSYLTKSKAHAFWDTYSMAVQRGIIFLVALPLITLLVQSLSISIIITWQATEGFSIGVIEKTTNASHVRRW